MATFLSTSEFTQLASEEQIAKTVQALEAHGIRAVVFETSEEARNYVLDLIPPGAALNSRYFGADRHIRRGGRGAFKGRYFVKRAGKRVRLVVS